MDGEREIRSTTNGNIRVPIATSASNSGSRAPSRVSELKLSFSAIALNHEAKMKVRLLPTYEDYRSKFGKEPSLLGELVG